MSTTGRSPTLSLSCSSKGETEDKVLSCLGLCLVLQKLGGKRGKAFFYEKHSDDEGILTRYRSGNKEDNTGTLDKDSNDDEVMETDLPAGFFEKEEHKKSLILSDQREEQLPTGPDLPRNGSPEEKESRFFRLDALEGVHNKDVFPPLEVAKDHRDRTQDSSQSLSQ